MAPLPRATLFKPHSHLNALHSAHKRRNAPRKSAHELRALAHAARFLDLSRSNGPKRPLHIEEDETLLDPNTMAEVDDEDGESHDAESSEGEDWADGVTLVSKFMDVDPINADNEIDELTNLVDGLKGPFGQTAMALKKDMIEVFIPTLDQVKKIHDQITNGPDRRFQQGIQKFQEYAPEFCETMSKHQEEFAQFHAVAQGATIDLFRKLKAAYEKKHEARVSFMETLKEKVQTLLDGLDSFDEQLKEVEKNTEKRLTAMKKLNQRQNNKDLLEYLRMAD